MFIQLTLSNFVVKSRNGKNSIRRALVKSFGTYYAFLGLYKLFGAIFTFLGSYYLVNQLIIYVEKPTSNLNAYMYALGLFLCALFSSIFINQLIAESTRIGVQVSLYKNMYIRWLSLKVSLYQFAAHLGSCCINGIDLSKITAPELRSC